MPAQGQAKRRPATQSADKPVKRTRVSRACDQCRIAREKCDGSQPTCSTCSASKRRCAYTANPKKRGIQPGYIRTLELALAWLFQQSPENEVSLNDKLAQGGASSLFLSRDSRESNKLHKRWRKARFCSEIDKLLSGGETSRQEPPDPFSPESEDDDSDAEDFAPIINDMGPNSDDNLQTESGLLQLSNLATIPQTSAREYVVALMPPDSWKLFEMYFSYTQSWLPICEKHDMLKLSYSYPADGLSLSSIGPDSGAHAELWSVLAVGSLHNPDSAGMTNQAIIPRTQEQFYETARSLVPSERSGFDLGHIKALLNLAVFNITQSRPDAAWILVGCASRILEVMDQSKRVASPRYKHTFAGCFLLDSMLALQLDRRPYFRMEDVELLGKIDEDGIEEWQPWNSQNQASSHRAPILALSTFNNLLDIVDILVDGKRDALSRDDVRLERWRGSLPSKLNYILSNTVPTPMTPPAVLLQISYYCATLISTSSTVWFYRILDVIERCEKRLGFASLPPMIDCLMAVIKRHIPYLTVDEITKARLRTLEYRMRSARPAHAGAQSQGDDSPIIHSRRPASMAQMPTPDSLNFSISIAQPSNHQARLNEQSVGSNQFGTLFPRPSSARVSDQPFDPLLMAPSPAQSDPRYPEVTGDLESFFDELASLDATTRPNNQPQFLQNLGFAPNASMADLFSEYIPMQSSAFLTRDDSEAMPFDQYSFYGAS